ncbi:DUF536 domain-containing protein [Lacticaseibacillus paracasei]|uniref:DUF536 domain-containing protein n=1 Tax=Lacticaseibacillus paracasei TaxID=1597 RepID=UPI0021A35A19|nr:DUF536 domain-containing protein [Lacticaseibacillus paracasei]MCT3325504.1 DUF536 domain-containing protein [Lacticaseibacillus paracasei]
MGKTIRELAEELNLSKSGIRKYLSASFRAQYTVKNAHRIMINDAGVKAIKEMIAHKGAHSERTPGTHSVHTKNVSVQSNNVLIEQLREKDKQIEHLQKLLDQSQQLQLMAEQKLKRLERPQNEPENDSSSSDNQIHEQATGTPKDDKNSPEKPRSFWQRFFGTEK